MDLKLTLALSIVNKHNIVNKKYAIYLVLVNLFLNFKGIMK